MAQISTIRKSQLEGAVRLDAEYYQPKFLMNAETLSGCPTLKEISRRITDFGAYSQFNFIEYVKDGVRFLRNQDVGEVLIYDDEPIYISQEAYKLLSLKLENGDLVLPRVGTLGKAAVITNDHVPCSANQNLAQVKLKKGINPFWVAVFLSTRYGLFQIFRYSTGNVQPWLNLGQIENLKVFLPSQKDIEDGVIESAMKSVELSKISKSLYSQAENLLLEELGLRDFEPKYKHSYTANLSKAFEAHRIDAEYFQPAFDQATEKVVSYKNGYASLLTCAELVRPDFDPGKYPDTSFRYVELADIDTSIGIIRSASDTRGEEAPSRARRILKKGDVIVSSVEGSLEKVALVDEQYEDSLASTGFFQFRTRGMNPEVLLVLSKSMVLQAQLKRECAGTILTAVPNESLKRIIIPILPPKVQQVITELVHQSHEARKKARQLLEEAKNEVENLIEGKV
jgi:hypothetical protein